MSMRQAAVKQCSLDSIRETNPPGGRLNIDARHRLLDGKWVKRYRFLMIALLRAGLKIGIIALAFVLLLALGLAVVFQSRHFHEWLQGEISQRSGYDVRAESLSFDLPVTIRADAVEVGGAQGFRFRASRLSVNLNPFRWATINRLAMERPVLEFDADEISPSRGNESAAIALRHLTVEDGTLVLKKGTKTIFSVPKINLDAQNINLREQTGVRLRADLPQWNAEVELQIRGRLRDLESVISILPKRHESLFDRRGGEDLPKELLSLRIKLSAPEQQKVSAIIESKFNRLTLGDSKVTGTLESQLTIDPGFREAEFASKAILADFPNSLSAVPIPVSQGSATADFIGKISFLSKTVAVKNLQFRSSLGNGTGEGQMTFAAAPTVSAAKLSLRDIPLAAFKAYLPAPLNGWSYPGMGRLSLTATGPWNALEVKGAAESDSLQVRGDDLAVTHISVRAPFEWRGPALRFTNTTVRATKLAYTPKGSWQAAAEKLQVDAAFDYGPGRPMKLTGRFDTGGTKFASPDNTKIGENLRLGGVFEVVTDPIKNVIRLNGQVSADSGELLWGKFFGDLKNQKPVLTLGADYLRDSDRLDCRRCELHLAKVGRVEVRGTIDRLTAAPLLHLRASSANFSSSGFFDFFLRETFNRRYPILDQLAVGGRIEFGLQLDGNLDAFSAAGDMSVKDGAVRARADNWQIGPLALNLPLQIYFGPAKPAVKRAPRIGKLVISQIRFANQSIPPIATTVSLSNNALRFHQPLHIGIFGGEIEIGNLFWLDVVAEPKQVSFSIETKRLSLDDMTQAMNWPRFSGTLSGSIPEVQSVGNLLRTRGEIHAELFGGEVKMAKLEIDNPFSALASIKLDAKLSDIQLEQLSKTFAFGRISGTLEGSIDGLVLTDGQPSELSADLHSVDRGGEQRISVEALNKITVLSSGADAGALYGGLASFFDSFRYSKLGFKAVLKNDRLTLRGVESRGDQEYLVVGSFLPPTVNIVSHTQSIAFSELLRRLERINKTDKPSVK